MPKNPWEGGPKSDAEEVGEAKQKVERNMRGILDEIKANPSDPKISSEMLGYWDRNLEAHAKDWGLEDEETAEYRKAIDEMKKRRVQ